jgi:WXG100 family type VII secretion target
MSRLQVDLDRLDRLVDHLRQVGEQLGRLRTDVDARVQQVHGAWTGTAALSAAAAHARWANGAAELHEALVRLQAIATTAHGNYAAAVRANRRMWVL